MFGSGQYLKNGSQGEEVRYVQVVLNVWLYQLHAYATIAHLAEDGIFGPKTRAVVMEFQRAHHTTIDGIVGPITNDLLNHYRKFLKNNEVTADDKIFGARVAAMAQLELHLYGFTKHQDVFKTLQPHPHGNNTPQEPGNNQRIVASCCEGVKDTVKNDSDYVSSRYAHKHSPPSTQRQGGKHLKEIYVGAGFPHSSGKDKIYRQTEISFWEQNNSGQFNRTDWCGIFCYYLYRKAGFPMSRGWKVAHGPAEYVKEGILKRLVPPSLAFPGCMGNEKTNSDHFFIVCRVSGSGEGLRFHCVDGNASNTSGSKANWNPIMSIITDRTRTLQQLTEAYFPVLEHP